MTTSSAPRPPLPALGLPRASRRLGPGAIVALVAHIVVIAAVIWERTQYLQGAMGDQGPRGGGGGGEQLRYVALPAAAEARRAEAPKPVVTEVPVPVPETITLPETKLEITPVTITPVPIVIAGVGEGAGGGPGSGGGSGGATGTGTGTTDGPGSGGDGGYIQPAVLRGLIITPDCVRGRLTLMFSVGADGKVARVDVEPQPKDAGCRRDLMTRMLAYKFYPAKAQDGRPVASIFTVKVEH